MPGSTLNFGFGLSWRTVLANSLLDVSGNPLLDVSGNFLLETS